MVTFNNWFSFENNRSSGFLVFDEEQNSFIQQSIFQKKNRLVRVLRGHKCQTEKDFMNEIGAVLQFPDYFGENWFALDDCLSTLYECRPFREVLLIVSNAELFLPEKSGVRVEDVLRTIDHAYQWWAHEVKDESSSDNWDSHEPILFKCLFTTKSKEAYQSFLDRVQFIGKNSLPEYLMIEQIVTNVFP